MKLFKHTDLAVQVAIVLAGLLYLAFQSSDFNFIFLYFVTGGWQIFSLLIHLTFNESWVSKRQRNTYGKTILWTAIIGIISWLLIAVGVSAVIFYLGALLVISPFFAIWYFVIGLSELNSIRKKELIHLK